MSKSKDCDWLADPPALLDMPTMLFFCFQKLMSFLNARKSNRSWTGSRKWSLSNRTVAVCRSRNESLTGPVDYSPWLIHTHTLTWKAATKKVRARK